MTTNEQQIAVTLLIGNKIHTLMETVAQEDWERMDRIEQEGVKNQLRARLASAITAHDLMRQMQVYVPEQPQPNSAHYRLET